MKSFVLDQDLFMPVLDKVKTCITTHLPFAHKGDMVEVRAGGDTMEVRVRLVLHLPLWFVKQNLWLREGFKDPEAFETRWIEHHGAFEPERTVYVHAIELRDWSEAPKKKRGSAARRAA